MCLLLFYICLDDEEFLPEAKTALEKMVERSLLQCMVTAIESDGVPYVELTKNIEKGQQVRTYVRCTVS